MVRQLNLNLNKSHVPPHHHVPDFIFVDFVLWLRFIREKPFRNSKELVSRKSRPKAMAFLIERRTGQPRIIRIIRATARPRNNRGAMYDCQGVRDRFLPECAAVMLTVVRRQISRYFDTIYDRRVLHLVLRFAGAGSTASGQVPTKLEDHHQD